MDTYIEKLNPNYDYSFFRTGDTHVPKSIEFARWLKEQESGLVFKSGQEWLEEMVASETEYHKRRKEYLNQIPFYSRKLKQEGLLGNPFSTFKKLDLYWKPHDL